jgi:coenzyme F420 hydrogenase subunit beta
MSWPADEALDPPRALRGLARIVSGGLCHRCGSCVGICPTGVLGRDSEDYPAVVALSACTDCDLCVKVCPGDEFDIEGEKLKLFGAKGDLHATHGEFREALLAHSLEPELRQNSTSGGLVSAILLHLLESKQIDGAVVIAPDKDVLWKGTPIIARSREEIIGAAKSKYAIAPTNVVFSEMRNIEGRYALVGLPCQIHGYIKAAALDQRLRERIVLTVGLFCHAAIEHEAYRVIWDTLGEKGSRARKFVSRLGKHPGSPHVELDDGSWYPVYFGNRSGYKPSSMEVINILYRLYTPPRCLTCFDALSEYADISIGDPWLPPPEDDVDFYEGWSFALARTARGVEAVRDIIAARRAEKKTLTTKEALVCNAMMAEEKRWRAFRVIETQRRQGKPIPAYGIQIPHHSGLQFLKTEMHMFTHIFCFLHGARGRVLRFLLSDGGYLMFWLNNKRRRFRVWLRDSRAKLLRKVFGRR